MKKISTESFIKLMLIVILILLVFIVLFGLLTNNANACSSFDPEVCPPPLPRHHLYLPQIIAGSLGPWMK